MKRFMKLGANLYNPESIKVTIANQTWSEGRKEFAVEAYTNFLIMIDGKWDPPRYRRIEKLPFIPTEQEIDQLIAGCGEKTATFLQTLKETGMRAGEAWNLKWTDIDFVNTTLRVTPEKRSNPRMFKYQPNSWPCSACYQNGQNSYSATTKCAGSDAHKPDNARE